MSSEKEDGQDIKVTLSGRMCALILAVLGDKGIEEIVRDGDAEMLGELQEMGTAGAAWLLPDFLASSRLEPAARRKEKTCITPDRVCEIVPGMTKSNLAQLRYHGKGPRFYKPTPRVVLYDEESVRAWLKASESTPNVALSKADNQ